ncbi:hypothetical protein BX616_004939 [Lobosporangium transversale]|nr:hypothetical protein BX616_004939 [Lobosporangium transversale]
MTTIPTVADARALFCRYGMTLCMSGMKRIHLFCVAAPETAPVSLSYSYSCIFIPCSCSLYRTIHTLFLCMLPIRVPVQAVLYAHVCQRFHDLASYASEPVKQRIHFLTKPDGSNLKELFVWDLPFFSSTPVVTWSPSHFESFILQHWSADQSPLNPPDIAVSWETTPVYHRILDSETVQAIIPIGSANQSGGTSNTSSSARDHGHDHDHDRNADNDPPLLVFIVLTMEEIRDEEAATSSLSKAPKKFIWRYHNMIVAKESNLKDSGWILLEEHDPQSTYTIFGSPYELHSSTPDIELQNEGHQPRDKNDNNDSDNDDDDNYWGQYGDTEDESATEGEALRQGKTSLSKNTVDGASNTAREIHADGDDAEEEAYWKKYAEQQEKQETLERKRRLQQEQEQPQQHDSLSSSTPQTLGHVDPAMLSSLLNMLIPKDVGVEHRTSGSEQDSVSTFIGASEGAKGEQFPDNNRIPTVANVTSVNVSQQLQESMQVHATALGDLHLSTPTFPSQFSLNNSIRSRSEILDSLRVIVQQATLSGYTKDEVFKMLGNAYSSLE